MGLSQEQQHEIVIKWRQASPRIKDFWYLLGRAFEDAITDDKVTTLDRNMKVFKGGSNVYISLPNGRILGYVTPRIRMARYLFRIEPDNSKVGVDKHLGRKAYGERGSGYRSRLPMRNAKGLRRDRS